MQPTLVTEPRPLPSVGIRGLGVKPTHSRARAESGSDFQVPRAACSGDFSILE